MTGWLNPFHVLGLPIEASHEEIVQRADELARTCGADEDRRLVAWAKGELTGDALLRARYERTEPRGTDYGRQRRFEDFVEEFTPNPVTAQSLADDGHGHGHGHGRHDGPQGAAGGRGVGAGAGTEVDDGSRLRPEDVDLPAAVRILIREAADAGLDTLDPLFQTLPATDADGVSRLEIRDVLFG